MVCFTIFYHFPSISPQKKTTKDLICRTFVQPQRGENKETAVNSGSLPTRAVNDDGWSPRIWRKLNLAPNFFLEIFLHHPWVQRKPTRSHQRTTKSTWRPKTKGWESTMHWNESQVVDMGGISKVYYGNQKKHLQILKQKTLDSF